MLFGGLELLLIPILLGLGAAIILVAITVSAVIETILDYWNEVPNGTQIINPELTEELQKAVKKHTKGKKNARIIYNDKKKDGFLVASDSISDELDDEDVIEIENRK